MRYTTTTLFSLVLTVLLGSWAAAADAPSYHTDVEPVLRKYCVGCHNPTDAEGDLSLQGFETLKAKTDDGPLTTAGNPDASRLIAVLIGKAEPKMPPEDEPAPSKQEIDRLTAWIKAGMPYDPKANGKWDLPVQPIASHSDVRPISALAIDPTGNRIAVGRYGQVQLFALDKDGAFDLESPLLEISDPPGKVTAVHFDQPGKTLSIASGITGLAGFAGIYSAEDGKQLQKFEGHDDILYDAERSPDGKTLATCGYDHHIILWNAETGEKLRELTGHNGAVYDVGFSPDSNYLVSGSADDTCKVWRVSDGIRLDTLPQPLKEVYCCSFSPDGKMIVAGGADNNLRVWKFVSKDGPKINPMIYARFAHEGPVQRLMFNEDGTKLLTVGNDLTAKLWDTSNYLELKAWNDRPEVAMAASYLPTQKMLFLGQMDGKIARLTWSEEELPKSGQSGGHQIEPVAIEAKDMTTIDEKEPNDTPQTAQVVNFPATIKGKIYNKNPTPDVDYFHFQGKAGQTWVLETKASRAKSPLDSHISICHLDGTPVERVKLQAVRDSYFTFRGKDDSTSDDFRVFNWEEMKLNQLMYCNGEVVKLWHPPRGPDSGYKVYPGQGKRWGYFDTTPLAHALGEPCYIVEALLPGQKVIPNGLPVFTLYYENDDESRRTMGDDSRLFFTVPKDGDYLVKLRDVRGFEGENFTYELIARPEAPDFRVNLNTKDVKVAAGSAQEIVVSTSRMDDFDGPIEVKIDGLPEGFSSTSPILIEHGQIEAMGVIQAAAGTKTLTPEQLKNVKITATADIAGQKKTSDVAAFKAIEVRDKSDLTIRIEPAEGGVQPLKKEGKGPLEFEIHPGETIMLKVVAERKDNKGDVSFGNSDSGRNLPFATHVANIGLNGLLIVNGDGERDFFIKAHDVVEPTTRLFHLKTGADGGHATAPVLLHVVPN